MGNNISDIVNNAADAIINSSELDTAGKNDLAAIIYTAANKIIEAGGGGGSGEVTGVKGNAESTYRKGNVNLTPTHLGLGNVDNTSDLNKPVSTAQQTALDGKVDKVTGKGLSENDYTDADKAIVDGVTSALAGKVDKVTGKGLSTNDYTDADKAIVGGVTSALAGKADASSVPTKTSDLTNDSGFITNLVNNLLNYYLKSETYSKTEVDSLLQAITTLDIQAVSQLPTTNISTTTIYLVPKQSLSSQDVKDEYINLDGTTAGWERIGTTEIDLSNYVTTSDLTTALANYVTSEQFSKEFFIGTQAAWNSLTVSQKTEHTFAVITDDYDDNPVGNLNVLTTTDKSSCVGAINELNTVATTSITELSASGLTLTWLDNSPDSHKAIRVGNLVIVNVGLDIDGTFTGTTGWIPVYDLPDSLLRSGESFITPHFTSMMCTNRRDNAVYGALIQGRRVWLDSSVDEYHLRICGQMILPIVKS